MKTPLPRFEEIKKIHIIGVCGTLMGSFAAYLKRRGLDVTGSDQNVYPPMSDVLKQAGVQLYSGYKAENLLQMSTKPDLVVVGNVISGNNLEVRAAIDGGYAYTSLPEAMEMLMLEETRNLVVCGTHGKTTTSSLLATVLAKAGKRPNYFIGGVSRDLPHSFHAEDLRAGAYFVLEGDEYDTAFWDKVPKFNHYRPDDVILTSVEFDHADIYPDFAAVYRAFEGLVDRVRSGGHFIACYDYESVRSLMKRAKVQVTSYALRPAEGVDYWPDSIRTEGEWTTFDVIERGTRVSTIQLGISGQHNVMNALAVWIECKRLGLDEAVVLSALKGFVGVKRRQELRGEVRGVKVIDDFAHHPTAVRETLKAFRAKYPGSRLVAVFEPRSATSRRKIFQKDYVDAFMGADEVFIAAPYDQSKIAATDQFSSDQLVADLNHQGRPAHVFQTVEDGVNLVANGAKSGDVVAVLSNGGFGGFIDKLLLALKG